MLALTQCWFTRKHLPDRAKHREDDESWTSHCRYCGQKIVSWNKKRWYPAEGFNVSRLAETSGPRFLYVVDIADDFVVARYPVDHLEDEAAIDAYRQELMEKHEVDESGGDFVLRDSIDDV